MSTVAIIDLHGQPHAHTQALHTLIQATGAKAEIYDGRRGRMPSQPAAVLITGGPGSPEDRGPWRRRIQAAAQAWAQHCTVMAIGLGFEVIAQANGWPVRALKQDRSGWHPITPTAVGMSDPLLINTARGAQVFEHRSWGVLPPPASTASRSVVLAYSSAGDVAAARFGPRMVGLIFHPEASDGPAGALPSSMLSDFFSRTLGSA
jgi:GMP synthase-like glutamine amidotransferase